MLGKLIKYEFKASSRLFLLLYGVLLLVSIINSILIYIGGTFNSNNVVLSTIQALFMTGYVILIAAVAVVTVVVIIMRFYKNLLGDEGYLMFTLPVNTDSHILSKLLTSIAWSILSFIVVIATLLIVTAKYSSLEAVISFFEEANAMGFNIGLWLIAMLLTMLLGLVGFILMFYSSMAIGANMTKNRLLGSFLGYIIMYVINQVIGFISVAVIYGSGILNRLSEYDTSILPDERMMEMVNSIGGYMFIYINILNLVMIAIYYCITRYFINNKLNLN